MKYNKVLSDLGFVLVHLRPGLNWAKPSIKAVANVEDDHLVVSLNLGFVGPTWEIAYVGDWDDPGTALHELPGALRTATAKHGIHYE